MKRHIKKKDAQLLADKLWGKGVYEVEANAKGYLFELPDWGISIQEIYNACRNLGIDANYVVIESHSWMGRPILVNL